jgi:hypothetical protein
MPNVRQRKIQAIAASYIDTNMSRSRQTLYFAQGLPQAFRDTDLQLTTSRVAAATFFVVVVATNIYLHQHVVR